MMRGPDKMAFEDRVLQYLDGALDDASSERLLAEIASDSEKAEIFAGHQELDKLIMTARVPLETPEETRRSIVAAIPGLTTYLPEFITTGTGVGLIASRWRAILDFFTQTPLRTALSIGGAAAIVTTGIVVTKNGVEKNAKDDLVSKTRVERVLPSASVSTPEFAMPSASASSSNGSALSDNASASSNNAANNAGTATSSSDLLRTAHRSTNGANATHSNGASSLGHMLDMSHERTVLNLANDHTSAPAIEEPRLDDIASATGRPSGQVLEQPKLQDNQFEPYYHAPYVYRTPIGVTVTAGFGTRVIFTPPVNGQSQPVDVSTPFNASIRYALTDAVSLMAEGGNASFMRIRQIGSLEQSFGALQHYRITTQLISDNAVWTRIGAEYQFANDRAALTPFFSGTVGAAFTEHIAPSVGVGGGFKWYWSDGVKLVGSLVYDQTWTRRDRDFVVPESAIVDMKELIGNTVSNSALTFSLGISTTF